MIFEVGGLGPGDGVERPGGSSGGEETGGAMFIRCLIRCSVTAVTTYVEKSISHWVAFPQQIVNCVTTISSIWDIVETVLCVISTIIEWVLVQIWFNIELVIEIMICMIVECYWPVLRVRLPEGISTLVEGVIERLLGQRTG